MKKDSKIDHVLAFYLPQFHPIKENNEWWGEGFTEWSNVAKSKKRFNGHRQPQLPADLGFYDLRLADTREQQAKMAKEYGITGFCYYHYWFNGTQLLERPLKEVLESKTPDFPFCICWANENWTRAWDGMDKQVLIQQDYTEDDSLEHFESLLPYFKDERYIKIDNKPLFLIYRYDHIEHVTSYFGKWREEAKKQGFDDLFICAVKNGFVTAEPKEIVSKGFDAVLDFQPNRKDFPTNVSGKQKVIQLAQKVLPSDLYQWLKVNGSAVNQISYKGIVDNIVSKKWYDDCQVFPCVFPNWDNSPRRKTPTVIQNNNPKDYTRWLKFAIDSTSNYLPGQRIVFINAWNEWAEGCHLEPDVEMGHTFLKATKEALASS
ncbi:glycoside hydrolase family 99-like domain-containing protein [Raoultella ornithinolytica]|jgi:lipopolysaccharide biosynthesis protein|uniref:Polysaccharide biosynthesis protein n=1 Tax=Klebsiella sp. 6837 TaxID=1497809 RepID=A0A0P0YR62_9ENTR|nr:MULTISPECIES: glycoside hydrolase family 99-like domain-containing protein [Raoultella]BAT23599.1 polysaccharide biosynthesis protein [Klebsiella sp. 6837]EKQ7998386.1 glycoside hydrolase family 99-like domain-containing protein [Raoultella ornithinolytica]EKU0197070.1 glycoside hydrolase family 99-like domain-containing protein [Raoultella ornithinolytica]EKV8287887.1 glycoside hydrolase family 99-like domain-containing protein [Raoultella ornithinolytica]EKW3195299.1 glycoside hydrolase f